MAQSARSSLQRSEHFDESTFTVCNPVPSTTMEISDFPSKAILVCKDWLLISVVVGMMSADFCHYNFWLPWIVFITCGSISQFT